MEAEITDLLIRMASSSLTRPADRRPDPDRPGWALLRLSWVASGAALAHLLGMGARVEVLGPDSLRAALAAEAARVVEVYANPR